MQYDKKGKNKVSIRRKKTEKSKKKKKEEKLMWKNKYDKSG